MAIDIEHLRKWIGKTDIAEDVLTGGLVDRFRATMDEDAPPARDGEAAPQAIHWCLAPSNAPQSEIASDGHAGKGGFLPPVPLPRRMWAGSRIEFRGDLRVGDRVTRRSRVEKVDAKQGRTGELCFVQVSHEYETSRGVAVREELDAVYRALEAPAARAAAETRIATLAAADLRRAIDPSAALLFRYSALTFNAHRIHYDRKYTMEVEHYPGLVVHGPLQATFLLRLAAEVKGAPLRASAIRAVLPLFDSGPFHIAGKRTADGVETWTENGDGATTMSISAS